MPGEQSTVTVPCHTGKTGSCSGLRKVKSTQGKLAWIFRDVKAALVCSSEGWLILFTSTILEGSPSGVSCKHLPAPHKAACF